MQRLYSRTTGSTYIVGYNSDIPDDAIEITEELYYSVIANPDLTKVRSHSDQGLPLLIDPPAPTDDEVLAANKRQQETLLTQASQAMAPVLVSLQLGDATPSETAVAKKWQAYYRALQAVDITSSAPDWPVSPA